MIDRRRLLGGGLSIVQNDDKYDRQDDKDHKQDDKDDNDMIKTIN